MADKSAIEWTDATWNPIVGCSIVSPGCTHCYAMRQAHRIQAMWDGDGHTRDTHYRGTTTIVNGRAVWTGLVAAAPDDVLLAPLRWKKPRHIFVNSMGDLFHESIPDEWIDKVFQTIAFAPHHTYQILTKRAARLRDYFLKHRGQKLRENGPRWPFENVWLGVSAERQQEADERVALLLETPAAKRFVSCEPLLGPVDLRGYLRCMREICYGTNPATTTYIPPLDWVIVGGESGKDARPMHPQWARALRDRCVAAGVPFFFKQWGEWRPPAPTESFNTQSLDRSRGRLVDDAGVLHRFIETAGAHAHVMMRVGKKAAGRMLDGRAWSEFPA